MDSNHDKVIQSHMGSTEIASIGSGPTFPIFRKVEQCANLGLGCGYVHNSRTPRLGREPQRSGIAALFAAKMICEPINDGYFVRGSSYRTIFPAPALLEP